MTKKVETAIIKATPTMCTAWLEKNEDNRPLKQNWINSLAQTMLRKEWDFNGESLKIDVAGNVLDGQHRMWACVESKVPFKTLIVLNLPRSVFDTIDAGEVRTAADILSIRKEVDVAILVAALKHIGRYYTSTMMTMYKFTTVQVETLLEQHPDIRHYARLSTHKANKNRWVAPSIVATCWYLASRKNKEEANKFFTAFLTGIDIPGESPILVLRNKLIDISASPLLMLSATHRIQLIILTWNLWRKEKTIKHFRLSTLNVSSEDFPSFK